MQRRMKSAISGAALLTAAALTLAGCSSNFSSAASPSASGLTDTASHGLNVLIGSSGDAETAAVKSAVSTWSKESGTKATVNVASDLTQQLSQGFASGKPADVFYLQSDFLAGYAANGSLLPYGDRLSNKSDFYQTLVNSFTYKGKFYCAPKDFSTLQLVINTDDWAKAGLTDSDLPTTWDQLATVAKKLTTSKQVGLAFSGEYARVGVFMAQAGGNLMNEDSTKAIADSQANVTALNEVKTLLKSGSVKYASDLGAGWGGEAFGTGKAAMTIEGNWITGALSADYPSIKYRVVQLPAGPAGKGTLQFTNCWGIAADSPNQKAALKLVEQLTSTSDQLGFSKAFGVMPSIKSAAAQWRTENPKLTAFLDGADYALGVPTAAGASDVVKDFNSKLETLKSSDPAQILKTTQQNLDALVK